jgi:hypothetical protein
MRAANVMQKCSLATINGVATLRDSGFRICVEDKVPSTSKSSSRLENGQSVSLDKVFKVLEGLGLTLLLFDHQAAGFVLRQRRMRIEQREREQAGARAGEQET